ncbi:carboxylic ester hydrolase-12 [Coleophoma crateriformis]|uniref:Carboxylic ester hydrolase n=1 Tax=Coleophoma crateriformis TaxID=565419 RepID=A0A3D8SB89_9HELO|nr:carboxylic ester hydrolase-12 [Coleophoma crateriformis]
MYFLSLLLTSLLAHASTALLTNSTVASPSATVLNGTYNGLYSPEWQQDHFLGIPYARPPVGPLRFAWPRELNTSFETRDAKSYGFSCYQYATAAWLNMSEDCLTLNVIRPSGTTSHDKLPVLVWIYGGGLTVGSTADPQYNVSGITHVAQELGKPVITVSLNYRLGVWGFLPTPQILAEGSSNAGLLDQRLALRWIQENIASFGGDPARVTIWGESAGAQSIGLHLYSYAGRNDGLFQAAILESGGPTGAALEPLAFYTAPVENLTRTMGCYTSSDQLACLRQLAPATLYGNRVTQIWNPIVDGDFLTAYPSSLTPVGSFIPVPLLVGANSDEGTSFGVAGLDNETAIFNNLLVYRASSPYAISPPTARRLLELYPNDPLSEPPFHVTDGTIFPAKGLQWRRECAIAGDLVMIAGRRKLCESYTGAGMGVWSYRFNTPLWNAAITAGAQHFANVVFSFQNISGALGPLPAYQNYTNLSKQIGQAYISFVNDHDPNTSNGNSTLAYWPRYDLNEPKNMVLNSNGSFVEDDTWRKEGIAFINTKDVGRELQS